MKIIKKFGLISIILIYLMPISVYGLSEPTSTEPAIAPDSIDGKYFDRLPSNQSQSYNLFLRSDGKIQAETRIVFENKLTTDQTSIQFTLDHPITIESAYQQVISVDCQESELEYCPNYPEYTADYYYNPYYRSEFFEITPSLTNDKLEIKLPKAVAPSSQSAIYLTYSYDQSTIKDSFGRYQLNWSNLKSNQKIDRVDLNIATDNKIYLKNLDQSYQYLDTNLYPTSTSSEASQRSALDAASANLSLSNKPHYQLSFADLESNESIQVQADFSASWWRINLANIVGLSILTLLTLICLYLTITKLLNSNKLKDKKAVLPILAGISTGLITPLVISILLWVAKQVQYNRASNYDPDILYPLIFLLLLIVGFILVASSLLLIPFMIWKHLGIKSLIITIIVTSIVMIIGLVMIIMASGTSQADQPIIEPYYY